MSDSRVEHPEPYPVVEVKPEWTIEDEAMGGRQKFWYEVPGDQHRWLFKHPRTETGEHWAEKIAAEIADSLQTPHAVVELAECDGRRGSVSKSFATGRELIHGSEVLAVAMSYDIQKRFGQSDHSLANIFKAFDQVFAVRTGAADAKRVFASFVVLDALVGNTDRHHENWGLLVHRTESGSRGFLAPTFDHASSLGRELPDPKRRTRLQNGSVGPYSEKGHGGIFWRGSRRYGPSPLHLVRRAAQEYPDLFSQPIAQVRERRDRFDVIVQRVPDDWMSPTAKTFTVELLHYNAAQLEQCLK